MELDTLRDHVADVLAAECTFEKLHKQAAGHVDLDRHFRPLASEMGWPSLMIDERLGGLGLGMEALCVMGEEFGRTLAPACLATMLIAAPVLMRYASDEQRDRYGKRAVNGELKVAVDLTLTAAKASSGQCMVLGGDDADLLLLALPDDKGVPGLAIADLSDDPDILVPCPAWDVTRRISLARLDRISPQWLGVEALRDASYIMALLVATDSLGLSQTLVARTIEYLKVREQFGRPLASFQALKHRIANLFIGHHLHRALLQFSAQLTDARAAQQWALLAKAKATDVAAFAAQECLQMHGAIGYTWEHECHLFLKRARMNQAMIADNDSIRLDGGNALRFLMDESVGNGEPLC